MTSVDLRLISANVVSREEVKRFTASVVPVGSTLKGVDVRRIVALQSIKISLIGKVLCVL